MSIAICAPMPNTAIFSFCDRGAPIGLASVTPGPTRTAVSLNRRQYGRAVPTSSLNRAQLSEGVPKVASSMCRATCGPALRVRASMTATRIGSVAHSASSLRSACVSSTPEPKWLAALQPSPQCAGTRGRTATRQARCATGTLDRRWCAGASLQRTSTRSSDTSPRRARSWLPGPTIRPDGDRCCCSVSASRSRAARAVVWPAPRSSAETTSARDSPARAPGWATRSVR